MSELGVAQLQERGFELTLREDAALPIAEWVLDLELERDRGLSAAEAAVLALLGDGSVSPEAIAERMGLGEDVRLVRRVLVELLRGGAVEPAEEWFKLTRVGERWSQTGSARARERLDVSVRLDPLTDTFAWIDFERPAGGDRATWTIDLPQPQRDLVLERREEIAELVRREGVPNLNTAKSQDRLDGVELCGLGVLEARRYWRPVELELWEEARTSHRHLVGYIGGAENPHLTRLLGQMRRRDKGRRIVPAS